MLALWKGKGVLRPAAPREKGHATTTPTVSSPKMNTPVVKLLWGAAMLIPKPPLPVGPAETPDMKGDEVMLPNTDVLDPQLGVWVTAPKPEVMAPKKEETRIIV